MKSLAIISISLLFTISLISCDKKDNNTETEIIFLHHSTGLRIWGTKSSLVTSAAWRVNKLYDYIGRKADLPELFKSYNAENNTEYKISKKPFPKRKPYGWNNFPADYYQIWVKNAGETPFMKEPTLEILSNEYDVIIFKHCFPVSSIQADKDSSDINSRYKSLANYKLQYNAIREKLHEFPDTKFILFTGAAQVKARTTEEVALRAREFFQWVREDWDLPGDNVYLWDLYNLQTEGGLYFKDEFAASPKDSHPNENFSSEASKLLFKRIIDVIEYEGKGTTLTGESA